MELFLADVPNKYRFTQFQLPQNRELKQVALKTIFNIEIANRRTVLSRWSLIDPSDIKIYKCNSLQQLE